MMKSILNLMRRHALYTAMAIGALTYWIFSTTDCLIPLGRVAGPLLIDWMPVGMFALLYCTFCKIRTEEMKPRLWHFVIQGVRTSLAALMMGLTVLFGDMPEVKLVLEGMFICFICPTAAAVVVVAEKLGGSIGSLTTFTLIANVVTMVIIPTFFPIVEREADITFQMAFMMLLRSVFVVLVAPLILALLSRRFVPRFVQRLNQYRNIGFYIWCINLAIISGATLQNIVASTVSGWVLWLLLITPLFVCLVQFALGKAIGRHWGDSISAGQALGQKNTVVGLWLTLTFLNPLAAVAPGAYVLWQNLVNGWQIWYKEKHGRLIW